MTAVCGHVWEPVVQGSAAVLCSPWFSWPCSWACLRIPQSFAKTQITGPWILAQEVWTGISNKFQVMLRLYGDHTLRITASVKCSQWQEWFSDCKCPSTSAFLKAWTSDPCHRHPLGRLLKIWNLRLHSSLGPARSESLWMRPLKLNFTSHACDYAQ